MKKLFLPIAIFCSSLSYAQLNPAVTSWIINANGTTGFAGIPTNVQQVQYSTNNVYISTTDVADWIPVGYNWPNNPWFPENQNFVFKITLSPVKKPTNPIATPYGHIGIWTNGVSIYNPKDAKSYLDSSKWFQNAVFFEHLDMETMDTCFGHPNNMHEYHLHVHPKCLWNQYDSTHHAPIIGFAFDGFPIYGSYAYSNTNGTGVIKRLKSSYKLRNITNRTTLPDGTILSAAYHGPGLSMYPLGAYMEDFEYIPGLGDLDEHNGRFSVTPEYPQGIYAYFVTIDYDHNGELAPAFPYVLGNTFYGTVQTGNTGPNSGHNIITEPVNVYTSVNDIENQLLFLIYPNPTAEKINLFAIPSYNSNMTVSLYNLSGQKMKELNNIQTSVSYSMDITDVPSGEYFLRVESKSKSASKKIIIIN